MKETFAQNKL